MTIFAYGFGMAISIALAVAIGNAWVREHRKGVWTLTDGRNGHGAGAFSRRRDWMGLSAILRVYCRSPQPVECRRLDRPTIGRIV